MNKERYEKYDKAAMKILGKSKITLKDYKEFKSIPFNDFTKEQQKIFYWYNEGMSQRLIEVIEEQGNYDFLD